MRNLTSVGRKAASPTPSPSRWAYRLPPHWYPVVGRGLLAGVFFVVAFAIDMATQQRSSAIWGSMAIVASVVVVFPGIRPALLALGGYGLIWAGFNLGRAVADDAGIAIAGQTAVSSVEARLFGGGLPTTWLQDRFHDPGHPRAHDIALTLVHLSFFITPFVVALVLWLRQRWLFGRYWRATAITFGLGLIGFVLLPTAPPWMSDPDTVTRVTTRILTPGNGRTLAFEPNHVAALPSVHVAIAVLVYLVLRSISPRWAWVGTGYALAMTLAVVYLGEHFVLDAVLGWGIALLGWHLTSRFPARPSKPPRT